MAAHKIYLKRRKADSKINEENFLELNIAYYRENIHRFITEYLKLKLYEFQNLLIYTMKIYRNFILIASRGGAKSTVALLFAIAMCILYPGIRVVVVCPAKKQSKQFVAKIEELREKSYNLNLEIEKVIPGEDGGVNFYNSSKIFTAVHSENALGIRCNILMVDEYVRCDESIITRVFLPFLSDKRTPGYMDKMNEKELALTPRETNREIYLSSIRHAEEWSYKKFEKYIANIKKVNKKYMTYSLPYHFGVKAGFIDADMIEQYIEENRDENPELIKAELLGIPERSSGTSFFSYENFNKNRVSLNPLIAMTDSEYREYKSKRKEWEYYIPKEEDEIRVLSMDVASSAAKTSDNTVFFITRMFLKKNEDIGYVKELAYGESLKGASMPMQTLRAKQLVYEFDIDYFIVDCGGIGQSVAEEAMSVTFDNARGEEYPAWKFFNEEKLEDNDKKCIDEHAVPIIYGFKPAPDTNHQMFLNAKVQLDKDAINLIKSPMDITEHLNKTKKFYKITDNDLRVRLLITSAQTNQLIIEAINLEEQPGRYIKLEKKGRKKKDRVSSFCMNLHMCSIIENDYILSQQRPDNSFLDYICFG